LDQDRILARPPKTPSERATNGELTLHFYILAIAILLVPLVTGSGDETKQMVPLQCLQEVDQVLHLL
jgi:hypothetical protein